MAYQPHVLTRTKSNNKMAAKLMPCQMVGFWDRMNPGRIA